MSQAAPRVWLITGSSSGIGLEMTRRVLQNGDIAVATLRKPEMLKDLVAQYPHEQLLVLKVDVTIPQDILAAFQKTKEVFGRIDVVVNNAGYSLLGEVEGTPDDVARALFEVNFWGATHVTQEAVRFFREDNTSGKGGRLLQISSGCGVIGWPSCGFYSATKHALEGLSETLAKELDPAWNIKVTIIVLGGFETKAVSVGMVKLPTHRAYQSPELPSVVMRKAILSSISADAEQDPHYQVRGDAAKAAEVFYRLSELPSPPLRLAVGKDVIQLCRDKLAGVSAEIDQYASWSERLDRNENC